MVAKHNFLWQFPLDFENNIFKVAFSKKIFIRQLRGKLPWGCIPLYKNGRVMSEELFVIFA